MSKKQVVSNIHLILLSGGSGTRLWPLSNDTRSKQFLKVLRDEHGNHVSMVQRVFSQIEHVGVSLDVIIATGESQCESIRAQLEGFESIYSLALEPTRRDTAPAIMLACAKLLWEQQASEDDTVIVMPIDTFADQSYYDEINELNQAVQFCTSNLVLLGVIPTCPSEKFGYIVPAQADMQENDILPVAQFVQKPSEKEAVKLIDKGSLWNCGVFAFKLEYMKAKLEQYTNLTSYDELIVNYSDLPKNSFDYEIVEKEDSISVIPYSGMWKDLGTWNALTEEMADYSDGHIVGIDTCKDTFAINELNIPVVVLGVDDALVVATPDGILVSNKDYSSQMKPYVEQISESRPMYERRRWGEYRVLDYGKYDDQRKALTKELVIEAGKHISYQKHGLRTEVWTVVNGEGMVALEKSVFHVKPGSVINIAPGQLHSVKAITDLHIIEVQIGSTLDESDIERFDGFWDALC